MTRQSSSAHLYRLFSYVLPHKGRLAGAILSMVMVAVLDVGRIAMIIPLTHVIESATKGANGTGGPTTGDEAEGIFSTEFISKGLENMTGLGGIQSRLEGVWGAFTDLPPEQAIIVIITLLMVLVILYAIFDFLHEYCMAWIGQRTVCQLRTDIFSRLVRMSVDHFNKHTTGEEVSRMTTDCLLVEKAITKGIGVLLVETVRVVVFAYTLFTANWKLSCLAFIILPVVFLPLTKIGRKVKRISRRFQERMADLNSVVLETLSGIRIVKAFSMEDHEIEKFGKENRGVFRAVMRTRKQMALLSPLMDIAATVGACLVIWFAAKEVMAGRLTLPILIYFVTGTSRLIQPFKKLSRVNATVQQALAASERIFSLLDQKPSVVECTYATTLNEVKEGIVFKDIWFAYGNEMVLKNVSFSVSANEAIAIIGPSGAGKSTLLNLILRFYDAKDGAILIDGTDIRDFTLESLLTNVSIVTQETILFNDSVRSNILYGNPKAEFSDVIRCAELAHAAEFIADLEQGYDTVVGERGASLSGGQRQRICIARAMLKNAPILLLDEATSNLDSESEVLVRDAITELMKGRTTITVAHRLSTVLQADRIVVMSKGRVVDVGTHEDLKNRSQFYQKVVELQSI